ncbi:hypothetical protein [Streptomyces sp. SAJ15]|uniref:hypothetical protein n=1 Tax=Streptomyces sp. SAJ15 TaxID=2011095 RepID=UPI0016426F8B|nr:hypothetical protein [Streptomyces sp. SAJ15]
MSEIAGTSSGAHTTAHAPTHPTGPAMTGEIAHEAYAFACMKCGHGWEQAYEIEHHIDAEGHPFVVYKADGERVPSPLTRPTCANCGAHVVRIMRSGQVSSVAASIEELHRAPEPVRHEPPGPVHVDAPGEGAARGWHLSDLLHPFQHHREGK